MRRIRYNRQPPPRPTTNLGWLYSTPPPVAADNLPWLRRNPPRPDTVADPGSVSRFQPWLSPTPNYYDSLAWHHPPIYSVPPFDAIAGRIGGWQVGFTSPPPPPPPPPVTEIPWLRLPVRPIEEVIAPPNVVPIKPQFFSPSVPPGPGPYPLPGAGNTKILAPRVGQDPARLRRFTELVGEAFNSLILTGQLQKVAGSTQGSHWQIVAGSVEMNRPPGVNDDSTEGAYPGLIWVNILTQQAYVNISAAPGAAIWKQITV